MKERLKNFLKNNVNIEGQQLENILALFSVKSIRRNTRLLSSGEISKEAYFISKGSIRTYYFSMGGKDKTRYVGFEDSLVTDISSFISQEPCVEYVETLEDTEVCIIARSDFYTLVHNVPEWSKFYIALLEGAYRFQNNRIASLTTLSAKQRFTNLIKENPLHFQRLSNRVLASYLDIREETLSRLKSDKLLP